jgi:hypothetical protein
MSLEPWSSIDPCQARILIKHQRLFTATPIATERGPNSGQLSGGPVGLAKLEIWRT